MYKSSESLLHNYLFQPLIIMIAGSLPHCDDDLCRTEPVLMLLVTCEKGML